MKRHVSDIVDQVEASDLRGAYPTGTIDRGWDAKLDVARLARALDQVEDANHAAGSYVGLDLRMSHLAEAIAIAYAEDDDS